MAATAVVALAAGGHGWNASALSASALLTGPAGSVAWSLQGTRTGKRIAVATILVNVVVDILLMVFTSREGLDYVHDTWQHLAPLVVAWAGAWMFLQLTPLAAAFRKNTA